MIPFSPFFRNPYFRPNTYYSKPIEHFIDPTPVFEEKKEETRQNRESPIFEIFGISLYFDDILIICLLFFLFQEGVDDEWLYIALILLLLS